MHLEEEQTDVCASKIGVDVENNIITHAEFIGGCPGNGAAVCKLVVGRTIDEVVSLLSGLDCGGKGTSCPNQLAHMLSRFAKHQN